MTTKTNKKLKYDKKAYKIISYRFICCKFDVVATAAAVKVVSECRLRALCWVAVEDFGGGAGGVDLAVVPAAFVIGLLGAELEFELVLLLVLVEFGDVVTVELVESFDDDV